MNFFWGLIIGYILGVLYMAYRANEDARVDRE